MGRAREGDTRFPFINLTKAMQRAGQMYSADPGGRPMAVPTAYEAWSYSAKSSGGHQTVSALKMYGLLEDSGANDDRRVRLSEAALRYFKDEREAERTKLLQQFALHPRLIRSLWEEWGAEPPADNVARSHLKLDRNLNEQSARSLLGIYKENLAYAGLKGGSKVPPDVTSDASDQTDDRSNEPPKFAVGDWVQWESGGQIQFTARRIIGFQDDTQHGLYASVDGYAGALPVEQLTKVEAPREARAAPEQKNVGLSERATLPLAEGLAAVEFPTRMSQDSYEIFEAWATLILKRAKQSVH